MIYEKTALDLCALNLCVLPAHADRKMPTVSWKEFQHRIPTPDETLKQFPAPRMCIVCGAVSGNLEILDFDSRGVAFEPWLKRIPRSLVRRLFIEHTPSGGVHCVYRCTEPVAKNQKLRMGPDGKVQIETRGEGGLFLCAPTEGYDLMQGSWETLPVFTPQERKSLWEAARTDSSDLASASAPIMEPPALRPAAQPLFDPYEGLSPAEDFNLRGDVRALLLRHGWTLCTSKSENEEWTRPGKTSGVSATLRKMDGIEIFSGISLHLQRWRTASSCYDACARRAASAWY